VRKHSKERTCHEVLALRTPIRVAGLPKRENISPTGRGREGEEGQSLPDRRTVKNPMFGEGGLYFSPKIVGLEGTLNN